MAKDAYYFSHDFGARNDPKLQKVLMKIGHEGKSIFWDLVEMLHEEGGKLLISDIEIYCFALRTNEKVMKSLIKDFGLFEINKTHFWSNSALLRIEKREEKSQKYSDAAKSRWDKVSGEFKMDKSQFYIINCYNKTESFFKAGITSEYISRRYSGKKMPYSFNIILQIFSDDYLKIESEYNRLLDSYKYIPQLPFGGNNECYSIESLGLIKTINIEYEVLKIVKNFNATHKSSTATNGKIDAIKEIKIEEIKEPIKNILEEDIFSSDNNLKEAFEAFVLMRKKIKKPLTDHGSKLIKLEVWNLSNKNIVESIKILNYSTMKSYPGVYSQIDKNNKNESKPTISEKSKPFKL